MALRDVNAVVTITTNAVKAIDDGKKLKQIYADINEQLNLMKSEGKVDTKEFKDMQKLAEDTKAKINEMLRGMELIDKVMGDISGHIGKDLNRALRETSKEFNKTSSSTDEGKAKLEKLRDVVADLKRELSDRRGLTMSLKDAEAQLKNLDNASLDKLRQGLAAVREEAAKTADPARRAQYQQYARNYEAQIAIKEHGNIGSAPATGTLKSEDRLRAEAERQRLVTAYQAASRSDDAFHKTWAAEALKQIQQYNSALQALTETERKEALEARNAATEKERRNKVVEIGERYNKKEKVSLEELTEAHKYWQEVQKKYSGTFITDADRKNLEIATANIEIYARRIKEAKMQLDSINVHDVAGNLKGSSIDELTAASKKGKEQFAYMKPGDSGYDQLKADLIAIDAELERVTPKWNELAQAEQALAKATDVANRAFADDKVMLNELTEAQKTLEAQIKKMSGLALDPADEMELEKAKRMLDDVNKALDTIALKDIDFGNLDATPTEKLEAALKNLEAQEKRLSGYQEAEAQEIANKKALIQKQLEKNKLAVMDVERAEQIAADRGKYSVQELKQAYETLQQKLLTLNTNQKRDIARTKADMTKLKTKIDDVTGAVKKQSSTWDSAVRNITAYVGVFGAFNFIKNKIVDVFKANTQLSDSLANIRKVSGLSSEAINELYNNISKIDSRNTIETLNELAYTGAKLGIGQNYGVEGLTGFVKAAEQVQMALGEDMGEKSLPELSKMVEVMGLIPKYGVEQSMQKAASAIFQLGATSTATGTNIVEFSKRLYGLANVSRISTQDLLALGSASDAMGLMPEVSATAFNKLFTSIQRQHNLIEQSLGMAKGRIKELYDEGKTMDAIVEIFERMNEKGNLNLLGNIFKDLGSDGARLVNVMATMADRADILRKHLQTSRDAFKEGEAVIGEYMIQNQTAAALLERSANLWAKAFVNPEGVDMVKELAQAWYDLSKAMTQSEGLMASLHGSLQLIGLAIESLIKMFPFLLRQAVVLGLAFGFKSAVLGVISLVKSFGSLINAIRGVHTAMGALNLVMKSNALWMIAASITSVITLIADYSNAAEEAAEREAARQAELKKSFDNSREAVEKVVKPLETYKKVLDEANLSEKQKMEMVKQFRRDYQEYLDYLGIEINSALDLANAYAKVVDIMKIKKAYEERENYRTQLNGETRMERIGAQSKVEGAARAFGLSDVDKAYLEKNQAKGTDALYRELIERKMGAKALSQDEEEITFIYVDDKLVNAGAQFGPRAKKRYKKSGSKELYNAIDEYIASFRKEKATDKEVDAMFDTEYSWTDKNGKKRKLSEFNMDEYNQKVQEARWKRGGSLDNEKPDKDAIAAAKKAAQEQKQAMRKDLKDAQEASTGIISKLEEYYRLQETAISEARADGKLTEDQAKEMVRSLNIFKNESLATARRAVVTGDTKEWDKLKTTILPAVMSDTSEVSRTLLDTIQKVVVEKLHDDLAKFNGTEGVFGLSSRAFFDQMRAKAAGNEREAARLRAKIQNEVEKALLQYQFVEKANQQMRKDVENMGITTETYEQWAKRMQQGIEEKPDTRVAMGQNARDEILQQFKWDWERRMQQPARTFNGEWNPASFPFNSDNEEQVQEWFRQFVTNAKWTSGIPKLEEWLKDGEKYKAEIRKFYESLILIQESSMQKSESVSPLAPVDETWMKRGQQGLDDLFSYSISDEQAYRQMGNKFVDMGVINFRYNIDNEEEARQWVKQFATDARGDLEGWAQAFPQLSEWIDIIKRKEQGETLGEAEQKALEEAMPAIRNLFDEMMRHADRLNKAMKDAFQHEKEQQESRFRIAGYKDQEEQTDKVYSNQAKQQETGAGQSFAQMLGLGSIAQDPEILQIQNRIYWRQKEVDDARQRLDAMKAMQDDEMKKLRETAASKAELDALEQQHAQDRAGLEQLLADRQTALTEQMQNLTTKAMQEMQKRVAAVKGITKPFADAANSIGKKLGDMIRGAEEDSITWNEIWKNMLLAVAESVIQMGAQYAENLVMQQSFNRASEAETMAHTTTEVTAGIAAGSAKTIGQLGWWGIPLIAIISALLMGLLQAALSTSNSSSNSNAAKPKIKLAQGMLTYDSGNLQTVVGDDGRVYRAKEQRSLPEGVSMVTEPIATRVNGQQALVGERGPEIVIGRRTTRAIQMNRPDLLRDLALIDRGITTRKVRTFDEGNISDMATAFAGQLPAPQQSADGQQGGGDAQRERDQAMLATLGVLSQTIGQLQQQLAAGIHAEMNMFGDNGAYKKFQQADKFYKKYGG